MEATILVIEDEKELLDTISEILVVSGFRVVSAGNGIKGVELAHSESPNLIICDIMMPGMDGYQVAERIRGNRKFDQTPFVFLSAKGAPDDFRAGLQKGADDYLTKPFEFNGLIAAVNYRLARFDRIADGAGITSWKDSANYAKKIQEVILPKERLERLFPNSFCLYKPRDIISGDFYWLHEANGYQFVAVADCTGHGVPGAMLTMICFEKLNTVISQNPHYTPAKILDNVNKLIVEFMNANDQENSPMDGMDIALCRIDYKKNEVYFSGAGRPMYLISGIEQPKNIKVKMYQEPGHHNMYEIQGDSLSISRSNANHSFQNVVVPFGSGDQIYLFSDGFADQFGGPKNKKFMRATFRKLIWKSAGLAMTDQENLFETELNLWKSGTEQTDDITVLGLKLDH